MIVFGRLGAGIERERQATRLHGAGALGIGGSEERADGRGLEIVDDVFYGHRQ